MRHLLTAALLCWAAPVGAEEFTTDAAKAAQAAYEADLQAAKEKYAAALDDAAKQAVDAGDLDEVVRIKDAKDELSGDRVEGAMALVRAQKMLEGTKWTWTSASSGRASGGLILLPDQKMNLAGATDGAWQMVEPRTLIVRVKDGIWFLYFNEDYTKYTTVLNYRPNKHYIKPGDRTSPAKSVDLRNGASKSP